MFLPSLFTRVKSLLGGLSTLSFGLGEAYFPIDNAASYADNYYTKNPVVYGVINYIAKNISSLLWVLYTDDEYNKNRQSIEKHAFLNLIRNPDPRVTRAEFFKRITLHYLLSGKVFLYKNMVGKTVKELNILRPDRCKILNHGVEYTQDDGAKVVYPKKFMIIILNYNPRNEHDGLSPFTATLRSVETNDAGRKWNFSLLKNMIKTGTWFETDGEVRDVKGMRDNIQEKFGGENNVGKTIVLKGGLKLKQAGFSPTDMDWLNSQDRSAVEFMQAYNFPPELMGKKSSYDNWEQAVKSFWNECALPIAYEFRDALNTMSPSFNNTYLDIDTEAIDALREGEDKRSQRVISRYQSGVITLPEARQELGYEPLGKGEEGMLYTSPSGSNLEFGVDFSKSAIHTHSLEEKARIRNRYTLVENNRVKFFNQFEKVVKKQFESELVRVQKVVASNDFTTMSYSLSRLIKEEFMPEWISALTEFHVRVLNTIGQSEMDALYTLKKSSKGDSVPRFQPYTDAIQNRIRTTVAKKVVGINERTRRLIKKRIDDGIEDGSSINEITKSIDELYLEQIVPNRSKLIAQTEVIATTNFASQAVATQSGLKIKKFWISTLDGKTRGSDATDEFDHLHMNGVETEVEEAYKELKSGEELMYPGDISLGASAGNTINCRCTEGYNVLD